MKKMELRGWIFLALCCDLGLFGKRIIAPVANVFTDALHIPGGIGTSFSLMFLTVAAALFPYFGIAAVMGVVQSVLAFSFGMVGSMGALSPIGYIVPGLVIDILLYIGRRFAIPQELGILFANALAAVSASLTANLIVFRLSGIPLMLYLTVAFASGAVFGLLAYKIAKRLRPVICRSN